MNRFHELARRMRPVHASWQEAVADLTLEQVNHHESLGVLPIAFSLMHLVNTEDFRGCEFLVIERRSGSAMLGRQGRRHGPAVFRAPRWTLPSRCGSAMSMPGGRTSLLPSPQTDELLLAMDDARWDEIVMPIFRSRSAAASCTC